MDFQVGFMTEPESVIGLDDIQLDNVEGTYHELLQRLFKELIVHTNTTWMLGGR